MRGLADKWPCCLKGEAGACAWPDGVTPAMVETNACVAVAVPDKPGETECAATAVGKACITIAETTKPHDTCPLDGPDNTYSCGIDTEHPTWCLKYYAGGTCQTLVQLYAKKGCTCQKLGDNPVTGGRREVCTEASKECPKP
ncbi:MAG: hypothetical protein JXL80_17265 [Planctomycetes bacterium]|nr:hypothetical protein [Planctomycetota bacterium]